MSGSYSSLARFDNSSAYIFAWVSRGASSLSENDWMGAGYTHALNRTNGRRVAVATLSDKTTLATAQASSTLGEGGDSQITWVTPSIGPDRSNAHVATFDDYYALVSWEEIASPECEFVAMGCGGEFTGTGPNAMWYSAFALPLCYAHRRPFAVQESRHQRPLQLLLYY